MSPEHVPAPQLASPAGAVFGAPAFLVPSFAAGLPAGAGFAAGRDPVEAAVSVSALVAVADAGVGAAAGVAGEATLAGADAGAGEADAGASDFAADALPEQLLAEHEA
jgi:hypothetical protein